MLQSIEETGATSRHMALSPSVLQPNDGAIVPHASKATLFDEADLYRVITAAVGEAAAVEATDPLLFVGLRLLQHRERVAFLQPPEATGSFANASPAAGDDSAPVHARLRMAEAELQQLRQRLHEVELAEAMKAMRALMGRDENQPISELEMWVFTDASTTIQAAFHGLMTRRWVREQRNQQGPAADLESAAATEIQAGMRGLMARQWRSRAFSVIPAL